MSWRGPWLSLVLLCSVGAALAQLPPRGITPTPTRPRQTPPPTVPAPTPTIPVVTPSPTPSTGIWTQWRVTVEYRETPDGPWVHYVTQQEQGTDRKTVTVTLWRYKQ